MSSFQSQMRTHTRKRIHSSPERRKGSSRPEPEILHKEINPDTSKYKNVLLHRKNKKIQMKKIEDKCQWRKKKPVSLLVWASVNPPLWSPLEHFCSDALSTSVLQRVPPPPHTCVHLLLMSCYPGQVTCDPPAFRTSLNCGFITFLQEQRQSWLWTVTSAFKWLDAVQPQVTSSWCVFKTI